MEVDGVAISADTHLSMVLAAGNTDPEVFGSGADSCDITLTRPALALTFGAGIHHCLGHPLS